MTNLEAARAKIADYSKNPVLMGALRWLCAVRAANEHHEYATSRDTAQLFMDGVTPISEYDDKDVFDALYCGVENDDSEEDAQIAIEEIDAEIEQFCDDARAEHEAREAERARE